MQIQSPTKQLNKSQETVYLFLADVSNFKTLMPDSMDKFEVLDDKTFKFALKGMPEIVLRLKEVYPNDKLVLGAASDKLPFTLTASIQEVDPTTCEVGLDFQGEFNAMMGMMIKSPITNFMEALATNMDRIA